MSNTTITIEQAVSAARRELDSMIFRLGDPNYPHANQAAQLLRAVEQVYQQARQKAEEDLSASAEASPPSREIRKKSGTSSAAAAAPSPKGEGQEGDGEPDFEEVERECEA